MVKDIEGKDLYVGDTVVYECGGAAIDKGTITKICSTGTVKIKGSKSWDRQIVRRLVSDKIYKI